MLEFPAGEASSGGAEHGSTIVTLECAGVLPSGTAVEVVQHIERAWARGQAAVEALRAELDVEDRDTLCPLVHGGVSLHKIYSVMHDTCNTANLVAELIKELQERKHREYLTDEVLIGIKIIKFKNRIPHP